MEKEIADILLQLKDLDKQTKSQLKIINQLENDRDNLIMAVATLTEVIRRLDFELQEGSNPDLMAPGENALFLKSSKENEIKPLLMNVEYIKNNSEIIFKFIKIDHKGKLN